MPRRSVELFDRDAEAKRHGYTGCGSRGSEPAEGVSSDFLSKIGD